MFINIHDLWLLPAKIYDSVTKVAVMQIPSSFLLEIQQLHRKIVSKEMEAIENAKPVISHDIDEGWVNMRHILMTVA